MTIASGTCRYRRVTGGLVLTTVLLFGLRAATAEETPEPVFTDTQRVTAADVLVAFDRTGWGEWATGGEAPKKLTTDDFVVSLGDTHLPVVALTRDDEAEPWHWLVWVDAELANPAAVRWALSLLGTQAEALASRGLVEVVVADPLPVQRLAPSDDAAEVERVLAELALHPPGSDTILSLRDQLLRELEAKTSEGDDSTDLETFLATEGLATALAAEEERILMDRHDLLLDHLTQKPTQGRKALLLVTGGFDRDPTAFYSSLLDGTGVEATAATSDPPLVEAGHSATGRTIAAYGWTPILLLPREPELLVRGWRIGKLLIRPVGPFLDLPDPEDDEPTQSFGMRDVLRKVGRIFLFGVHAKVEEHRDPAKADAYLELAEALRDQGKIADAGESYEMALYHFANDPRTAEDQARAYAGLGEMLAEQGELGSARSAFEAALTLEPGLADRVGATVAFEEPVAGWQEWADLGKGALVRDRMGFATILEDLDGRWRLTYQLEGLEPGALAPLRVELADRAPAVVHPSWGRVGTPAIVTEARLRQLLASHNFDPVREEGLQVEIAGRPDALRLRVGRVDDLEPEPTLPRTDTDFRVSVAREGGGGLVIEHRMQSAPSLFAGTRLTLPTSDDPSRRLAVLVEDLAAGDWGAAILDLE